MSPSGSQSCWLLHHWNRGPRAWQRLGEEVGWQDVGHRMLDAVRIIPGQAQMGQLSCCRGYVRWWEPSLPPAVGSRRHSLPGTLHTSVCLCVCVCFPSSPSLLWGFSVLHLVLSVMASTRNILFSVAFQRMCKYSMRHYIFPL